ncbi:hypothetical protein N4E_27190 [Enterococcus faecalis]|nr:hypothetical protein N4E_27190 [Enterococcus faecalis]
MDITDKENFQKQMDFLKRHNFYQYVYQFRWLFVFIPVLVFLILFLSIFLVDNSKRHIINGNIDQ